jgi:hypothetical protein
MVSIWGSEIFDNDVASATKSLFEDSLNSGMTADAATLRVFDELKTIAENENVLPVMIIALASLHIERKTLTPEIRDLALDVIHTGKGLNFWAELGDVNLQQRRAALQKLQPFLT